MDDGAAVHYGVRSANFFSPFRGSERGALQR
jgi:hypothetical protein